MCIFRKSQVVCHMAPHPQTWIGLRVLCSQKGLLSCFWGVVRSLKLFQGVSASFLEFSRELIGVLRRFKCIGVYYDCSVKMKFSKGTVKSLKLLSLAKGLFKCMLSGCSRSSKTEIYYIIKMFWKSEAWPLKILNIVVLIRILSFGILERWRGSLGAKNPFKNVFIGFGLNI